MMKSTKVTIILILGLIFSWVALTCITPHTKKASGSYAENVLFERIDQSFPKPFPPRDGMIKGTTSADTPYLVMRIIHVESDQTEGVTLTMIQSPHGEIIATAQKDVAKLTPGTYFKFVHESKANVLPFERSIVGIPENEIDQEIKRYRESGVHWGP